VLTTSGTRPSFSGLPVCEAKKTVGEADQPGLEGAEGRLAAIAAPAASHRRLSVEGGGGARPRTSFLSATAAA